MAEVRQVKPIIAHKLQTGKSDLKEGSCTIRSWTGISRHEIEKASSPSSEEVDNVIELGFLGRGFYMLWLEVVFDQTLRLGRYLPLQGIRNLGRFGGSPDPLLFLLCHTDHLLGVTILRQRHRADIPAIILKDTVSFARDQQAVFVSDRSQYINAEQTSSSLEPLSVSSPPALWTPQSTEFHELSHIEEHNERRVYGHRRNQIAV